MKISMFVCLEFKPTLNTLWKVIWNLLQVLLWKKRSRGNLHKCEAIQWCPGPSQSALVLKGGLCLGKYITGLVNIKLLKKLCWRKNTYFFFLLENHYNAKVSLLCFVLLRANPKALCKKGHAQDWLSQYFEYDRSRIDSELARNLCRSAIVRSSWSSV